MHGNQQFDDNFTAIQRYIYKKSLSEMDRFCIFMLMNISV